MQVFRSVLGYYWYLRLRGWEIDAVDFQRKGFGNSYALQKQTNDNPGATHEMGWRDFDGLTSVSVLPLSTKGEWRCLWRSCLSIFLRSRIPGVPARSIIG